MKYSIIIPTYNNCDKFLKPCISALLQYTHIDDIELIISANGCTDNTLEFLGNLQDDFTYLGMQKHLKIVWNTMPLGYPKATNEGIKSATCDKLVMLNNDAILLDQPRGEWLRLLSKGFEDNKKCGISCSLKKYSPITNMYFGVFFCVMIDRNVIDDIGMLDEGYGTGGNEDIDFCALAQLRGYEIVQPVPIEWSHEANLHIGTFPLWHKGEGTVHDPNLVSNWEKNFSLNELRLAQKYNMSWYTQHKDKIEGCQ